MILEKESLGFVNQKREKNSRFFGVTKSLQARL